MDNVYELELREGDSGKIDFLCRCVEGFSVLWGEFAGTSYRGNSLEGFLSDRLEWLDYDSLFIIAKDIRNEVRSLLPCSMTAEDFEAIMDKHIDRYLENCGEH